MKYLYQLKIQISGAEVAERAALIKKLLTSICGVLADEIIEEECGEKMSLSIYDKTQKKLQSIKEKFNKLKLKKIKVQTLKILNQDWQNAWKKDFRPFDLTKDLMIVPAWMKDDYSQKPGQRVIFLDSNLAFGTGMHETTQFMAQLIERLKGKFETFCDIGTGTGILALVAWVYGARLVYALDISEDCIKNCEDNLALNNCAVKTVLTVGDFGKDQSRKKFDFVAANLVSYDLLNLAVRIVSRVKNGGYLAISGISLPNFLSVKKRFLECGLKVMVVKKGKTWSAMLFKKG